MRNVILLNMKCLCGITASAFLLTGNAIAAVILDPRPEAIDRFYQPSDMSQPAKDFIGAGLDFSGVGRVTSGGTTGRWATLIGDNIFMSANHFKPATGSKVSFASSNTVASITPEYTVGGGFRVGNTDLWIGYFTENVANSITRYSYSTTLASNLAETNLAGVRAYGVAQGASTGPIAQAVGLNVTEGFVDNLSFLGSMDALLLAENIAVDDISMAGANDAQLAHEFRVVGGDSGSPLFINSAGNLQLIGIASGVANVNASNPSSGVTGHFDLDTPLAQMANPNDDPHDPNDDFVDVQQQRNASVYNYTGSYETEINAAIASVPEPSSALLSILAITTFAFRRRR